jgi:hypothetical protein
MIHRLYRFPNSPKSRYAGTSKSKRDKVILLEKTSPHYQFPVYVKFIKKNNDSDFLLSPSKNTYTNLGGNISFINANNKNRNSIFSDESPYKNRLSNKPILDKEYEILKLKKSLQTPQSKTINAQGNNDKRKNRFITISQSHSSKKEKNEENNPNIEIKIAENEKDDFNEQPSLNNNGSENNFNSKHKMRYLLSKNYKGMRFYKGKNKNNIKSPYSNRSGLNNNNTHNTINSMNINFGNVVKFNNKRNLKLNLNSNNANKFTKSMEDYNSFKINNLVNTPGTISTITDNNQSTTNKRNSIKNKLPKNDGSNNAQRDSIPYVQNNYNEIIQEEIHLKDGNIFLKGSNNENSEEIDIKLDDLIFIEGRLNDIIISLNNKKNIFDISAINETVEFFSFYFHSTLRNKFPLFFISQNRIIVQSAFNLNLFLILITYHLSLNTSMLIKIIILLRNIFELLKINLYLFVRKMEMFYGEEFCQNNEIYFKTFDRFLKENDMYDLNENEIIIIINKNCVSIVNDLENILNYYKTINNKYYQDFQEIYMSISKLTEQDISNYFYNNLYNALDENEIMETKLENINENNNDINNNYENENIIPIQIKENDGYLNKIILSYKKNKAMPPFIRSQNKKKYTLVLDLEDTIINVKIDSEGRLLCRMRPGLITFLNGIKPFYEIVSFTKLSKEYSDKIIEEIQGKKKIFDYNLYREHCTLVGTKFVKDIRKIGRDMRKIVVVDDLAENLRTNGDNGILISPYKVEDYNDRVLFELKKILILFFRMRYEDVRIGIKNYQDDIYNKITLGNVD